MKSRHLSTALVSIFYLLVTTGFILSVHYCHGKPVNFAITLTGHADDCGSGSCGEKGCCEDENTLVQISAEHILKKTNQKDLPLVAPEATKTNFIPQESLYPAASVCIPDPPVPEEQKFSLFCSRLFYG